ncbi:UNVERIFIED_CONTAM: hypothetical protein Sradi_3616900 [Sesamum radiatum]|uniref:Reverse transcriptase domain-containing protein n=1 Tax=Sesamum radiatum TaxID=300843 RepID=A0AAW2QJ34_SESRA
MDSVQGVAVSHLTPPISHLLFVDDTFIFCQASLEAMYCIRNILLTFKKVSGLKINLNKSAMVVSQNVDENRREELARVLGVTVVSKHDKYLGLPTVACCSKRELFASIKDRI